MNRTDKALREAKRKTVAEFTGWITGSAEIRGRKYKITKRKMTGIELIAKERQEQIEKHNWSLDHDKYVNSDGQIMKAVDSLILCVHEQWPSDWDPVYYWNITRKPATERLAVIGALIAAEIDRIQSS